MYNKGIDMRVHVNGRPTREYSHKGSSFIEARHGSNYSVKIKNDNNYRVMVVISVDGLDVITGKAAEKSNKGYIVEGESKIEIKGYRISDDNSAAFVFSSKDGSYVAQVTGDKRNSGVIGVRVFKEKVAPSWSGTCSYPTWTSTSTWTTTGNWVTSNGGSGVVPMTLTCNTAAGHASLTGNASAGTCAGFTSPSAPMAAMCCSLPSPVVSTRVADASVSNAFDTPISYDQFDTGTKWGKKLDDKVKREYFVPGDVLTELTIYYASLEGLTNMGIDLSEEPKIAEDQLPQAFNSKYCQPPIGWNG